MERAVHAGLAARELTVIVEETRSPNWRNPQIMNK